MQATCICTVIVHVTLEANDSIYISLLTSLPSCRLSELVRLVSDGLHYEFTSEAERIDYGNRLKSAIANFTVDFIPHMNEEEEVCVCECMFVNLSVN